jgi:hypothetical protein
MNRSRETMKMAVPPGNRPALPRDWFRGVPERYVTGADTRGRQEGRPYPWSQQVIHETSGLRLKKDECSIGQLIVICWLGRFSQVPSPSLLYFIFKRQI